MAAVGIRALALISRAYKPKSFLTCRENIDTRRSIFNSMTNNSNSMAEPNPTDYHVEFYTSNEVLNATHQEYKGLVCVNKVMTR